jgi:hypothetical protein
MGAVHDQYYEDVLRLIGVQSTDQNLKACYAWQAAEGGSAAWNPWNTTQPAPGATNYNSAGVKSYPSAQVGYEATAKTLTNGRYAEILASFRTGNNGLRVCEAVDASPWGTHHAADVFRSRYKRG